MSQLTNKYYVEENKDVKKDITCQKYNHAVVQFVLIVKQ